MGNRTNPKKWDARQRLDYIEGAAFWRGWIVRGDLVAAFGISLPQATADLKSYQELNPSALEYDVQAKRYWGSETMKLKLTEPDFARATRQFLGPEAKGSPGPDRLATIDLPSRALSIATARQLFRAICQHARLRIHYYALTSGRATRRWISPHAFAFDGYRWHVRAYCHEDHGYKDFVIGRIEEVEPPVEADQPKEPDHEWNTWEKIRLRPNAQLGPVQRRAVEMDYCMKRGELVLDVRRSMKAYTLAYLRLADSSWMQPHLVLDDTK